MTIALDPKFKLELMKLEQYALLDLWEVDLRKLTDSNGEAGQLYRFYAGTNELQQPIIWQGNEYTAFGVMANGFEMSGQGVSNRPTLTLANINGLLTGLVNQFAQCLGAVVLRRRVYAKFLDAVNFSDGNPHADPTQERLDYYVIEQLSSLTREAATFTLALPTETDNALINRRIALVPCAWVYRSAECGYTGEAVADEKDQPTTDIKKDACSHCLRACKMRNNQANYGGFIAINKLS